MGVARLSTMKLVSATFGIVLALLVVASEAKCSRKNKIKSCTCEDGTVHVYSGVAIKDRTRCPEKPAECECEDGQTFVPRRKKGGVKKEKGKKNLPVIKLLSPLA